jgi:cytochrome c553
VHKKPEPFIDTKHISEGFDWVAAGKTIWDGMDYPALRLYDAESIALARSSKYVRENARRLVLLPDGTIAIYRWVITPKGIALSATACSSCHSRHLEDGTVLNGPALAQRTTDVLIDKMYEEMNRILYTGDTPQMAMYRQFGVPWIRGDIHESLKTMTVEEIGELFSAYPPGGVDRVNGSPFYLTKIPDLIGIRNRKYIDHTATHKHRDVGDLMRYAALVECCDSLEYGSHHMLSDGQRRMFFHWPDEVLYALAQYIYSLQPPPNPNPKNALALRGEIVFAKAGCPICHTPPLYTITN